MQTSASFHFFSARIILAGLWGMICSLAIAAPILLSNSSNTAASFIYLLFSRICHQIPERSFQLFGHPMAVCHRCLGIYIGLFLGSLIKNRFFHRSPQIRRVWIMAAVAPMLLDFCLSFSGLWHSAGIIRFSTGLVFGSLISSLLVRGVSELLHEAPWRQRANGDSLIKGGI